MSIGEEVKEDLDHYNILITPSSEMFNQALVVMMSAIVNCKLPCHFYIMQCAWTEEQKEECRKFLSNYSGFKLEIITINELDFKSFVPWGGRYGTYYKILAHQYLPNSVERILYLDCDTYIAKDIYQYYSMDFENNFIIGSTEYLSLKTVRDLENKGNEKHGFINGGVLLFNLRLFRTSNITIQTYMDAVKQFNGQYFADQGLLCFLFADRIKVLPSYKYNHLIFQEGTKEQIGSFNWAFSLSSGDRYKMVAKPYQDEIFDEKQAETIIHFTGVFIAKPWHCIPKILPTGRVESIETIAYLNRTQLRKPIIEKFYLDWWHIAKELPEKNFYQLLLEAKEFNYKIKTDELYNANASILFLNNVIKFLSEFIQDAYGTQKFERYIKNLSGKNIAILKQQDVAASVLKKVVEYYNVNITYLSNQASLYQLKPEELENCKKANVVISCCVHGTKTHERDGVKCIDILDILRDESLTAGLPTLESEKADLERQIADLRSEFNSTSQKFGENALELVHLSERLKRLEIKIN